MNSLKSLETSLADKLDKSDHDKSGSEKRVSVSETNNFMGENISQNITKAEEVAVNAQKLTTLQEKNLAESSVNTTTILELAKVQDKCISASFVNTVSILNLKESQENLKTENTASFELIKKVRRS